MRRPPTEGVRPFVVVFATALFALANYSCQSLPPEKTNAPAAPAASPAQVVVPPYPSGFPASVPPAAISGNIPFAVPLPTPGAGAAPPPQTFRPNFDYFSWQSFIALNWPAATGARGVPDQPNDPNVFLKAAAGTPVVWGTYKDSFDLFGQKDQRPNAWDAPDGPITPCPNATGQKALIFTTKGDTWDPLESTCRHASLSIL